MFLYVIDDRVRCQIFDRHSSLDKQTHFGRTNVIDNKLCYTMYICCMTM